MSEHLMLCQNPTCGGYLVLRKPHERAFRKYCSHRCAGAVNMRIPSEARARGGKTRARRARERLVERVGQMDPVEAFLLGFKRGVTRAHWRMRQREKKGAESKRC